jgi:hypothetical protein
MPLYVYETTDESRPREQYEFLQGMSDPPFSKHPETGVAIRRVVAAPSLPGRPISMSTEQALKDKNLDRLGFTKYVKTGDGSYEKRAGAAGPDYLQRD